MILCIWELYILVGLGRNFILEEVGIVKVIEMSYNKIE